MTDAPKEKEKTNLIPKPVSQAFLAGASASSLAVVFGVPIQYAPRVALAGVGFSLWLSWVDSRNEARPKKRKGRAIPFSTVQGVKNVYPDEMEFSTSQGGYITRKTWKETFFGHRDRLRAVRVIAPIERPKSLNEFIFRTIYQDQAIELREVHVKLFLNSAWRNRRNGKGLSVRHWERRRSQRPAWFRELHPIWFRGMSMLLWNAQKCLDKQLFITLGNQQSFLTVEPRELFGWLKYYEYEKRKKYDRKTKSI